MDELFPISRDEAKEIGQKWFFTGSPCKNGHVAKRQVSSSGCMDCNKDAVSRWRKKTGYKTSPEYLKAWCRNNPEKVRSYQAFRCKAKVHEKNVRKRAQYRNCTPPWITDDMRRQISSVYDLAKDCTATCGERYEVDHIIPIMSDDICGLHVPWNLQVLPMDVNRSKRNKWRNCNV